jgi:hypothetical protein
MGSDKGRPQFRSLRTKIVQTREGCEGIVEREEGTAGRLGCAAPLWQAGKAQQSLLFFIRSRRRATFS